MSCITGRVPGAHLSQARTAAPPSPTPPRKAAVWVRWLRRLAIAFVSVALFYVIGANVFLAFGISKLFESTNSVNTMYRRAWTFWPGTVYVRDLRFVFQDHNVQFSIELKRAVVDIRLTELAARTFHATRLEGDGLGFFMRHRIQPETASEPWVATLPPIREFDDPPLYESRAPEPPIPEDEYNLWTVHIENVDVGVEQIWAQFVRYRGAARASGSFRLRPARHLWVGPATLAIDGGNLFIAGQPFAKSFRGLIECTIHPFDVRIPVGNEVFRHFSGKFNLQADGVAVQPFDAFAADPNAARVRSAPGTLNVDGALDHGKLTEQTRVAWKTPAMTVELPELTGSVNGVNLVMSGAPAGRGQVDVTLDSGALRVRGTDIEPLRAERLTGSLTSSSRDTTASWDIVRSELSVGHVEAPDLRWFNAALRTSKPELTGKATMQGSASYADGRLNGAARAELRRARAGSRALGLSFDGKLGLEVTNAHLEERSGKVLATVRDGAARLQWPEGSLEARGVVLDGDLSAESAQGRGRIRGTLGKLESRTASAVLEAGGKLDLNVQNVDLRSLAGNGSLTLDVENARAQSDAFQLEAKRLKFETKAEQSAQGVVNARLTSVLTQARGRNRTLAWRAEPSLSADVQNYDRGAGTGDISASLSLRNFSAGGRDASEDCPLARVSESTVDAKLALRPDKTRALVKARVQGANIVWDDFRASLAADLDAEWTQRAGAADSQLAFAARTRDVRLRSGASPISGWDARVPALRVAGQLAMGQKMEGTLKVQTSDGEGRIGRTHLETDLRADLRVTSLDLRRSEARVSGDVHLSDTTVRAGDDAVQAWWARIGVDGALVSVRENVDLSTMFHAELRDATPGLVALSAEDAIPDWLVTLLPLRELDVKGSVNRRCRLTDIRFTSAEGGPLLGNGRLQSISEEVRGAFLVRLSSIEAVSAGIGFTPGGTDVKLLAGDSWLEGRLSGLDASAEETLGQPCVPAPSECRAPEEKAVSLRKE